MTVSGAAAGREASDMDRKEALRLLRDGPNGVEEWNRRRMAGEVIPKLGGADLFEADLSNADLRDADLRDAHLSGAEFSGALLSGAKLYGADFTGAYLSNVLCFPSDLNGVSFFGAHLLGAKLRGADLQNVLFNMADLRGADFSQANLAHADLRGSILSGANLSEALCYSTIFDDSDLSEALGLESVDHRGPSMVGTRALVMSSGRIPEAFLRGCGVPEALITYLPSIIGSMQPIQFYSCFISYSSQDTPFAERLHADLQAKGVRCWFAPNDLKIGDRFRMRIDESIRVHDKLLLVLSEGSVASQEVESEVEAAMDREKAQGGTVLFPIRLDDAAMGAPGWPALVRRTRHIGDFTRWKDHDAYQAAFTRLLKDLKAVESVGKA
jgi:hypothetical protein